MIEKFDALLVVSFGGPEGMDDVLPFLANVLKGKNVPEARMIEVAKHYEQYGGISPINEQNRILISALESHFKALNFEMPIYWGNRNWHPMLADTVQQMANDGIKNALYFVTSAYASYSGCRQYRENLEEAISLVESAPKFEKLRLFFNHPGFIKANVAHLEEAFNQFDESRRSQIMVLFSAHSIPISMSSNCNYENQIAQTGKLIAQELGLSNYKFVYQSRSGPPQQPWLEPDILKCLEELAKSGDSHDVIVHPIGFLSDHMEVVYDLDNEANQLASKLGLNFYRAKTVGSHQYFIDTIYDLILEKTDGASPEFLGDLGLCPDQCNSQCCTYSPTRGAR